MWPRDASLENWATRLQQENSELARTCVHASNQFEGFAPLTARRLAALARADGSPVRPRRGRDDRNPARS